MWHMQGNSPHEPIYFGRRFRPYVQQGYMSGGAGYVLSREALDRFVLRAMRDSHSCRRDMSGVEDVELGQCLALVGVMAGDSRDEDGRERFHPFTPDIHLIRGRIPRNYWYWEYNYYPAREVCLHELHYSMLTYSSTCQFVQLCALFRMTSLKTVVVDDTLWTVLAVEVQFSLVICICVHQTVRF